MFFLKMPLPLHCINYVLDESGDSDKVIQCRGRGIFRKNKITPLVGDYVVYQAENDKEGYLMEIKKTRTA